MSDDNTTDDSAATIAALQAELEQLKASKPAPAPADERRYTLGEIAELREMFGSSPAPAPGARKDWVRPGVKLSPLGVKGHSLETRIETGQVGWTDLTAEERESLDPETRKQLLAKLRGSNSTAHPFSSKR
jgi:hypothetical protein